MKFRKTHEQKEAIRQQRLQAQEARRQAEQASQEARRQAEEARRQARQQKQEQRCQVQEQRRQQREEQRRQQAEQRRREEEYRQQQALQAQQAEAARQAAHAQAFIRQWTADVDRYSHFGAEARGQVMTNTINAYFPPPAGFMHDYHVVWHGRNPDGTLDFEFLRHQLILTPDEIARRQANNQMWQNIAMNTTIAMAGGRIAGSIDRNTRAINNASRPNYIGPMGRIGPR